MRLLKSFSTLLILLTVTACSSAADPQDAAIDAPGSLLLISEVMTGAIGDNRKDFIELYNPGNLPGDLAGHSLWYQLKDGDDEVLLYQWEESTLVPPNGHYLLVQSGQEFGLAPDASFNQPMVPSRGGLVLRAEDNTVIDALSWGTGPSALAEGSSASAMEEGISLQRLPGGDEGNWADFEDNALDFQLNHQPHPQNSGSQTTPFEESRLVLSVVAPQSVNPGSQFDYRIQVTNQTGKRVIGVSVQFQVPAPLTVVAIPYTAEQTGNTIIWPIDTLEDGEITTDLISVTSPWTYTQLQAHSYFVQAENFPTPAFGGALVTKIEGGAIPVETARQLIGEEVVVEGTVTMYPEGFFAGSGTKFYLEDETGGVQVYIPGAQGQLAVRVGERVRVQGIVEPYRGALEIIPASVDAVERVGDSRQAWPPTQVTIRQAANDTDTLPGQLVQVEGLIARVEEFSFSYEIDLLDDSGGLLTLYIDKNTGVTIEALESGQHYRVTGIMEILDQRLRLYPRLQSDLERIYPPTLRIEAEADVTVQPGEEFEITFIVYNDTPDTLTGVQVFLPVHAKGYKIVGIEDQQEFLSATFPELAGNGGSASFSSSALIDEDVSYVTISDYKTYAVEWKELVGGPPVYTFVGTSVPVWAIQGAGSRSPYAMQSVRTEGIVTAAFPDLGGFWIQETVSDDDPLTSAGLFINTGSLPISVSTGDLIAVSGQVRESFQQTQILVETSAAVEILRQSRPLPVPLALDPPADEAESLAYFEAREGMLVSVADSAVVVGPTTRYGEFAVVLPDHQVDRTWQHQANGFVIRVDDGSDAVHEDRSTLDFVVRTGDQISGLLGPLAYNFGNYKIVQAAAPSVTTQPFEAPSIAPAAADEFNVMTWNVENLFDFLEPHPSSPSMPTVSEYKLSLTKVANTILAAGAPTIIGLQEVENIGILEDIAEHSLLAEYEYQAVLVEGDDSRGIDVGYLVRGDRAEILSVEQFPAPEGITSRPPLMIQVRVGKGASAVDLYILNNHFTSMSGGEAATEPRRTAQAAWNVTVMQQILSQQSDANIVVMGDLNSFYASPPIDTLREAGLVHVFDSLPPEERYTYIYQGVSQTLDHILATLSLNDQIRRVEVLHLNADFPLPSSEDDSAVGKSDHDPVVVTFGLP